MKDDNIDLDNLKDERVENSNEFNYDNITLMRNFTVDEVKDLVSSYDDEFLNVDNDKRKKLKKILIILGVVLFLVILFLFYFFVFAKDNNKYDKIGKTDEVNDELVDVDEIFDDNVVINIYKHKDNTYGFDGLDSELIHSFECENKECVGILSLKDYVILKDGEKSYIYDYTNSSKIASFIDIKAAKVINSKDGIYGFLLVDNSSLCGVFNIKQKAVTVPFVYNNIYNLNDKYDNDDEELYIENDLLKVVKDNKYGVVNAKLYNSVIDIENDNVRMGINNIYAINNKLEFIYGMDGKKLLNGVGYDYIYDYSDDGYAIVKNGDNIDLIDYDNMVISNLTALLDDTSIYKYGFVKSDSLSKAYVVIKNNNECIEYYYDFSSFALVIDAKIECDS